MAQVTKFTDTSGVTYNICGTFWEWCELYDTAGDWINPHFITAVLDDDESEENAIKFYVLGRNEPFQVNGCIAIDFIKLIEEVKDFMKNN